MIPGWYETYIQCPNCGTYQRVIVDCTIVEPRVIGLCRFSGCEHFFDFKFEGELPENPIREKSNLRREARQFDADRWKYPLGCGREKEKAKI